MQNLFKQYGLFIFKYYGYKITGGQLNSFLVYCRENDSPVNGVKPVFNPINLYAYCSGTSSDDATADLLERKPYEQRTNSN